MMARVEVPSQYTLCSGKLGTNRYRNIKPESLDVGNYYFDNMEEPVSNPSLLSALAEIYPPDRLLYRPAELVPYESDALTSFQARPLAVVLVESQADVIDTVRLCHQLEVPFVARGSGTSLSGGSLPVEDGIVIGLNRLNRILQIDARQRTARVEAGVVNQEVSLAAGAYGLYYAPDPSSQLICTI